MVCISVRVRDTADGFCLRAPGIRALHTRSPELRLLVALSIRLSLYLGHSIYLRPYLRSHPCIESPDRGTVTVTLEHRH